MTIDTGSREVEVSNADKVFFPDADITKGDLARYYDRVGDTMLPHVRDRALTLQRYPDGIEAGGFYQKDTPDHFPDWITRKTLEKEGGTVDHVVCTNRATLVYLADQGCITPHIWLSRVDRPRHPDRLIFDLDPPEGSDDLDRLHDAVRAVGDLLQGLELPTYLMTTGSAGYHVVVPLDRTADFDDAHELSRRLAGMVAERAPDLVTTAQRKQRRGDKVFVDYLRNSYAQTSVAPYSVRSLPGAPVATPIEWDELGDSRPRSWGMGNLFRRLGQTDDPWQDLPEVSGVSVSGILGSLD